MIVDNNAKLEEARRKAAVLQQQLEQLRAGGGNIAAEAQIKNELVEVNRVLGILDQLEKENSNRRFTD